MIVRLGAGADDVSEDLSFRNIHYFAAGATLFGSDTMGIYQYEGKEYAGRNMQVPGYDVCAGCHDVHALTVKVDECSVCHGEFEEPQEIRMMSGDWDGDNKDEGVYGGLMTCALRYWRRSRPMLRTWSARPSSMMNMRIPTGSTMTPKVPVIPSGRRGCCVRRTTTSTR